MIVSHSALASVPRLLLLTGGFVAAHYFLGYPGLLGAIVVFYLYAIGSRRLLTFHHRQGVGQVMRGNFTAAIPQFLKSLEDLQRRPWIDRYRSLLLFSSSATTYREMALANIGFCHTQLGNGSQAREYYEMCLREYPGSQIASSALRLMDAGVQASQAQTEISLSSPPQDE